MALVDITDENFRQIYQQNEIVILDFWAVWCGPCRQFMPIYEEVSNDYEDIVFGKIETENNVKISQYFQVRSIPTVIIIRDGLEMFRNSGLLGAGELKDVIAQVKNADMDEVKKNIENEENNASE